MGYALSFCLLPDYLSHFLLIKSCFHVYFGEVSFNISKSYYV